MSWFKRNKQKCVTTFNAPKLSIDKQKNILGEVGTIGVFIPPHLSENERHIINEFGKARHILHSAESMYLRGIKDGAEATIDFSINYLEELKEQIIIQTTTNEYTKRSNERVEITFNK